MDKYWKIQNQDTRKLWTFLFTGYEQKILLMGVIMKAIIDYTIDVSAEYDGVDIVVPHDNYIHIHGFTYGRVYSLDIRKDDVLGIRFYFDGKRDIYEGGNND